MSWHGYVPKVIWDLFGQNHPVIAADIETYGMLRKHEVNEDLIYLFSTIRDLRIECAKLKHEMEERRSYTQSLEQKLLEHAK